MKEIFFSSNDEKLAGKLARRMMLHLSISVDEDVQQTLSFFEKVSHNHLSSATQQLVIKDLQ